MSVNEYVFRDSHKGVRIVVTPADYAFAGQNDCVLMYKNVSTTRENSLHLQGHTTFSSPLMPRTGILEMLKNRPKTRIGVDFGGEGGCQTAEQEFPRGINRAT